MLRKCFTNIHKCVLTLFGYSLRQYKVQIQQMRIERNVKAQERKAIIKHINHRTHALGKKNSRVRIREHKMTQEKLYRWAKENLLDQPSISTAPPSREYLYKAFRATLIILALPSCISIYTNSVYEAMKQASPLDSKHQRLASGFTNVSDMTSTLAQRLLKYAQSPKQMIESQETRAVFNDLQLILSHDYTSGKRCDEHHWNCAVKEDIIQVRNLMNVTQALLVSDELKGM